MIARSLFAAVLTTLAIAEGSAQITRFATWPHDVRLVVRWPSLAQAATEVLNATRYLGRFDTGYGICRSYDVSLFLDPSRTSLADLSSIAWLNPGSGFCARASTHIKARFEATNCPTLEPSIGCNAAACVTGTVDSLGLSGRCTMSLLPDVEFGSIVSLPFSLSNELVVVFRPMVPGVMREQGSWYLSVQERSDLKVVQPGILTKTHQTHSATPPGKTVCWSWTVRSELSGSSRDPMRRRY
jgi:hypothetical protein